tara:strand:- start:17 stop:376 length:360 start_codon:yes stop_codon:yes gene_type:complete
MFETMHVTMTLLLAGPEYDAADPLVGSWCDRPIPNSGASDVVWEIRAKPAGSLYIVIEDDVGRTTVEARRDGNRYVWIDAPAGDCFVVEGWGLLGIYDEEGFVRHARHSSHSATCVRPH